MPPAAPKSRKRSALTVIDRDRRDDGAKPPALEVMDANGPSLTKDLQRVFDRAVTEARAENLRALGVPDLPVGER